MLKRTVITSALVALLCALNPLRAQTVIVTDDPTYTTGEPSAVLDVKSSTKGLIIPRLTQAQRNAIISPVSGLLIYQTDLTKGLYYYTGTGWIMISSTLITQLADADQDTRIQVESVADEDKIRFSTNGAEHMIIDNLGNIGIGTTTPTTKLDVNGLLRIRGGSPATGKVLTTDASGNATWEPGFSMPAGTSGQTFRHDGTGWVANSLLLNNGTGLGVGASPLANNQLYLNRPGTSFGASYANIYAYRTGTNTASSGGSGWMVGQVDAAIKGFCYYGNNYTASVAGYSVLNYPLSAAVFGGKNDAAYYGALAFRDENNTYWGGYFNGNVSLTGTLRIQGGSPGTGKILTSDNDGNATWQIGASQWTSAGSNIYYNAGNVGIGTSNPTVKLEVTASDIMIHGLTMGRGSGSVNGNCALGYEALFSNTTGNYNTALGYGVLTSNKAAGRLTAIGYMAMYYADDRITESFKNNTAIGYCALRGSSTPANNTGYNNTAIGDAALSNITSGGNNTSCGNASMVNTTTGNYNTTVGSRAMYRTFAHSYNTAIGYEAMYNDKNTSLGEETNNTAIGAMALRGSSNLADITGHNNTAVGVAALYSRESGGNNTAVGYHSLMGNASGSGNTAVGYQSGYLWDDIQNGTFIGYNAHSPNPTKTNQTAIGYGAQTVASNMMMFGNSSITSIGGYASWTTYSDQKFKKNVEETVAGLDFILNLRPVTYNVSVSELAAYLQEDNRQGKDGSVYSETSDIDRQARAEKETIRYTGFIAQEVEAAAIACGYDFSGIKKPQDEHDLYGLRYAEFVAPLVKAVQEQQQRIEQLEKEIEALRGQR